MKPDPLLIVFVILFLLKCKTWVDSLSIMFSFFSITLWDQNYCNSQNNASGSIKLPNLTTKCIINVPCIETNFAFIILHTAILCLLN